MKKKFRLTRGWQNIVNFRKIWMTMKLTTLLLLIAITQMMASETYSQATKLTLQLKGATLKEVLNKIEEKSEYFFLYNSKLVDVNKKVSVDVKEQRISDLLSQLFTEDDVAFVVVDRQIILSPKKDAAAFAIQQQILTGTVTDATSGDPVIGANVIIEGTTIGVITDENGKFSIDIPSPSVNILVSFIGYNTERVQVSGQTTIAVKLVPDITKLDEVVVVGYGTQKRVNLTGSVSVIDIDDLKSRPITQASQALQGKMAGVTVTQNFGAPGSDAGTIRIRGIGTLGNNNPMVLVDGVEGNLNDINPNDIESISVLKDAASASIYGSRAASGVILVTTRRGSKNEKMSVTYNGIGGIQVATRLPKIVDGYTYMVMKNESERNQKRSNIFSDAQIEQYLANRGKEPYFDTDWFSEAMRPSAPEHQHTITVRGGSEKIATLVSISNLYQDALIENSDFKRTSLRVNTNFQASNKISFIFDGFLRREDNILPNSGIENIFRAMTEIPSIYPAMWTDGSYGEGWNGANPLAMIRESGTSKSGTTRVVLSIRGIYEISSWLKWEVALSQKYLTGNYTSTVLPYNYKRIDGSTGKYPLGLNSLSNSNNRSLENFYQSLLKFNKSFGKHSISSLIGVESNDFRNDAFSATRQNFLLPEYQVLSAGDANYQFNGGSAYEWALASVFSRLNYTLSDKYMFEANIRYDGSSRFASDRRWGWFPSFSAGWRISEEEFLKSVNAISNLKLRASWGELGNQNIGNYPYLGSVSLNVPYFFGKTIVQGAGQSVLPNRNVTWETTRILNAGIDFGILNNRLTGSFDLYKKNTFDILYKRDIPSVIGLDASEQNIAEMQNIGWDLQLSWNDKISDFMYGVDFSLSDVKNKVINLNGKPQYGRNVVFEGEEYDAFYGYQSIGIYRTQEDLDKYPRLNPNVGLGDLIYKDLDGDNIIDPLKDKKIIGSNIPRFVFGTSVNLAYKNFDASIFLQGVGKKDIYYIAAPSAAFGGTFYDFQLNRYIPDDPSTFSTANWTKLGGSITNNENSTFHLHDAKYLRLKNVTIGYNFPKSWIKKLFISNLRIYTSGENLATFDNLKIKTIDPEAPNSSLGSSYYPNTKKFVVGIDVKF
jgi:TonB-linked SusC/RagA family outer membrane protein